MLASPRGRIDFGGYMQVAANVGVHLPCVHYPRSEDTCLNQVLHGGLELAARMTLDNELGGRVRRLAKSFAGRITSKKLDAAAFAEAWFSLDRRTSAYRPALTLIQMLLNTHGAALTDTTSPTPRRWILVRHESFFSGTTSLAFLAKTSLATKFRMKGDCAGFSPTTQQIILVIVACRHFVPIFSCFA